MDFLPVMSQCAPVDRATNMKLHKYVKKLFDDQNPWRQREKKMAKENQRKVRGVCARQIPLSLRHLYHYQFGYIWWRPRREHGTKNEQGQLLPQNQLEIDKT